MNKILICTPIIRFSTSKVCSKNSNNDFETFVLKNFQRRKFFKDTIKGNFSL